MPLPTWSCVCRWSSVKGEGDIFSFDLLDGSGGEIRVTAFNEVAHELFPLIEMGSIYTVSRANLKNKNTVRHYVASTAKASTRSSNADHAGALAVCATVVLGRPSMQPTTHTRSC